MKRSGIDFVISWLDGDDAAWRREMSGYLTGNKAEANEQRFRNWGNLKYWFRGVEKYAPWVGRIHFVTCGHLPKWLNTSHPKLHIVRHEDYIPKEYLPTFNPCTIEWNMHRIPGLSEKFVYFNDDFFLTGFVRPDDFFCGGLPCDMLAFQPVVANPKDPVMSYIYLNNTLLLSKHFRKRENVLKQPGNYFKAGYPPLYFFYNLLELAFPLYTGFYTVHGPSSFLKTSFENLWEKERVLLHETCCHRFRNKEDVNQYAVREWQKLSGNFKAKNITARFRYFNVQTDNRKLVQTLLKRKADMICINDTSDPIDFLHAKRQILWAFEQVLPDKCSFESD